MRIAARRPIHGVTTTTAITLLAVLSMAIAMVWSWQQLTQHSERVRQQDMRPVHRLFLRSELQLHRLKFALTRQANQKQRTTNSRAGASLSHVEDARTALQYTSPFLNEFLSANEKATQLISDTRSFLDQADRLITQSPSSLALIALAAQAEQQAKSFQQFAYAATAFDETTTQALQLRVYNSYRSLAFLALLFLVGTIAAIYLAARTRGLHRHTRAQLASETIAANQTEELFNEALATAPDAYIVFDRDGKVVMRNAAVDRVYGQLAQAIQLGQTYEDIVEHGVQNNLFYNVEGREQEIRRFVNSQVNDSSNGQSELVFRTNDERWVRVVNRRSPLGYTVTAATDLTRMKFTEQALRESEAQYRGILQDHSDFIVRFDPKLNITYLNPAYAKHLGKNQNELLHANLAEILPASAMGDVELAIHNITPEQPSVARDLAVRAPNGQDRWENWTIRGFLNEEGVATAYQALGRDISKEKVATEALVSSARLFRSIAEAHPIPVLLSRVSDYKIVYANEASFPLLGKDLTTVTARTADEYFADKATLNRFTALMQADHAVTDFPAKVRNCDGQEFQAQVNARVTRYAEEAVLAVSIVDMTERNEALEQLNHHRMALARSEKLSALGSLLASVSHELNNPLAIVVGQSQLLEAVARDSDVRERANKISRAAKRSARIVKTFLSMVRQRPPTRTPVHLNETIEKSLEVAEFGLKSGGIELRLDLDPDLPAIQADEDQLVQVAVNLIINASQALQELPDTNQNKEIVVKTSHPEPQIVRLSVSDSGHGISPGIRTKVFDPFFTTKDVGVGTGIGLSVTSNIVRAHAGKIEISTSALGGAQFDVDLPVAKIVKTDSSTAPPEKIESIARGRILIVDDEPEVGLTICDILKLDGYQTELVHDGDVALTRLIEDRFDLVITDLRMPGIDGPTLYREIQRQTSHRADRIVFTTGDALNVRAQKFLEQTSRPAIEKPFQPNEIRALVRSLLAQESNQAT